MTVTARPARTDDLTPSQVRDMTPLQIKDYVQAAYERQRRSIGEADDREALTQLPKRVAQPTSLIQRVVRYHADRGEELDEVSLRAFVPVGRKSFAKGLSTLLHYGKVERFRKDGNSAFFYKVGGGKPQHGPRFDKVLSGTISAEWFLPQCPECGALDRSRRFAASTVRVPGWSCTSCGCLDEHKFMRLWLFDLLELDLASRQLLLSNPPAGRGAQRT